MEWIAAPWYSWPFAIGAATVALVAIRWMWANVARPAWEAMKWIQREIELHDTLKAVEPLLVEISESFKPNDGSSFYDCVMATQAMATDNARRLERMEEGQAAIRNLIEVHLVQRRNGGRRSSDPH